LIAPRPLAEAALSAELSERMRLDHENLLTRFVDEKPNALRPEVRRFRALLATVADQAAAIPSLWHLAHRARWWASYWYEREFGDSQFEPFLAGPDAEAEQVEFNLRHVDLVAFTLTRSAFEQDIVAAAQMVQASLPSLAGLTFESRLASLRLVLERTGPEMRWLVLGWLVDALEQVDPQRTDPLFVQFLQLLPGVHVVQDITGDVLATVNGHPPLLVATGFSAEDWAHKLSLEMELEQAVDHEAMIDLTDLLHDVIQMAA
jgi:hypothetical protein